MQNKKTLLQINTVVNSCSHGRIAEELGQMAMKNDWESYIAFGRNERPSKSKLIKIGNNLDVALHGLQTRLFDRHGLGSCHATEKLIRQIDYINPSVIHLQNIHGYYLNIEVLFKYLAEKNTPVVWTFHDCWPMTGHCSYFDYVGCTKWQTGCHHCPQLKEYPSSLLFDRSRKNYRQKKELFTSIKNLHIVTVSNWLMGIVKQSFFSQFPVSVINNGINIDIFKPTPNPNIKKKYNLENKFIVLGVANVWDSRKGLDVFIELSKLLDDSIKIVLVGLNTTQIKSLPNSITAIPRTENTKELAELYSIAGIYLNLSVEETFGLTTIEAMACGTPALVYNATALPETITDETGFIVKKGDIQSILNCINKVKLQGKSVFTDLCIEHVRRHYDKNICYQPFPKLYESLIEQKDNKA